MEHVNLSGKGLAIEAQLYEDLKEKMELSLALKREITGKEVVSQDSVKDDGTVSLTREEKERLKALGYVK